MTIEEQLQASIESIASLESKCKEMETAIVAINEKCEVAEKALAEKTEEVVKVSAELEKVKADAESLKSAEASASSKAAKILASVGVKPTAVTSAPAASKDPVATRNELWTQYKSIKDLKERNAFYQKNRSEML